MNQTLAIAIVGYRIEVLDRFFIVKQKPTYPVVLFISDDEYDRLQNNMMFRFVVRETLECVDGSKIIVNYIKKSR